jgi:hypothetical protein
MKTPWDDADWHAAELTAYRAALAYARHEVAEAQREVEKAKLRLADVEADHAVHVARTREMTDTGSYDDRTLLRAATIKAERRREKASSDYGDALGKKLPGDPVALMRAMHEAARLEREAYARANNAAIAALEEEVEP